MRIITGGQADKGKSTPAVVGIDRGSGLAAQCQAHGPESPRRRSPGHHIHHHGPDALTGLPGQDPASFLQGEGNHGFQAVTCGRGSQTGCYRIAAVSYDGKELGQLDGRGVGRLAEGQVGEVDGHGIGVQMARRLHGQVNSRFVIEAQTPCPLVEKIFADQAAKLDEDRVAGSVKGLTQGLFTVAVSGMAGNRFTLDFQGIVLEGGLFPGDPLFQGNGQGDGLKDRPRFVDIGYVDVVPKIGGKIGCLLRSFQPVP